MYDVIIIGLGASGAFLNHLLDDLNVLVLESTSKGLEKVRISGGGKANFTNLISNEEFISRIPVNSKILFSLLKDFSTYDIYSYFENLGLVTEIRDETKVFCKNSSNDLINVLLKGKTNIKYNQTVTKILNDTVYTKTSSYTAKKIIICTGGLSYPKTGSTGFIFDFCKKNELSYINPYPVEASINLLIDTSSISGTSFNDVIVSTNKKQARNNLLFTHTGLSGFSSLEISEYLYLAREKTVSIDFSPDEEKTKIEEKLLNFDRTKEIKTFLKQYFTSKFCDFFLNYIKLENKAIKQLKLLVYQ